MREKAAGQRDAVDTERSKGWKRRGQETRRQEAGRQETKRQGKREQGTGPIGRKEQDTGCQELSQEELKRLQLKSLEILRYFDGFCRRHKLRYFLCGGCCIGTIRHQGFIPWDDDIDLFMPRPDYERLRRIWAEKVDRDKDGRPRYVLCRSDKEHFLRSMLTAITDEQTTFIKERQADLDMCHGVRVEILPLDGCPKGRLKRKLQILWALTYQVFNLQEAPTSKGKVLEWIGRAMLALFPTQRLRYCMWRLAERRMMRYPFDESRYITELCSRYQYMVNEYPKEIFARPVFKEFEGEKFPIPAGYDRYLTMAFGDYRKLPPENERVAKHGAVVVDLENGYEEYRGSFGKGRQ